MLAFRGSSRIMTSKDRSKKEKLVEETARFWSQRTSEHISHDDAREMIQNVSTFFGILKKWQLQKDGNLSPGERKTKRKQESERIYRFENNATMPKI